MFDGLRRLFGLADPPPRGTRPEPPTTTLHRPDQPTTPPVWPDQQVASQVWPDQTSSAPLRAEPSTVDLTPVPEASPPTAEPAPPPESSHDEIWSDPPWRRDGRDPSLDELIPSTDAEIARWEGAVREEFARHLNGLEFAGMRLRLDPAVPESFSVYRDSVVIRADILDGERGYVGQAIREFRRDHEGRLIAEHVSLKLSKSVHGRGFADQFNEAMRDWYRYSGVDHISLRAASSIGGYAWARAGFDWQPETGHHARNVMQRLGTEIRAARADAEAVAAWAAGDASVDIAALRARYGATDPDAIVAEIHRQQEGARDILDRAARHGFGNPGYPSPYEVSRAGWNGQRGPEASWLGKRALLGADWRAYQRISDGGPFHPRSAHTSPEPSPPAGTDPDGHPAAGPRPEEADPQATTPGDQHSDGRQVARDNSPGEGTDRGFDPRDAERRLLDSLAPEHREVLESSVAEARIVADAVLADLRTVTAGLDGFAEADRPRVVDEQYRSKSLPSLARKFADAFEFEGVRPEEFLANLKDRVRFTVQVPAWRYAVTIEDIIAVVSEGGYRVTDVRNFWLAGNRHNGVNITMFTPGGVAVEVQFSTELSRSVGKLTHRLYEVLRLESVDPTTRVEALLEILKINRESGIHSRMPMGLERLPAPIDNSFARWIQKQPHVWEAYLRGLAERRIEFWDVIAELGLSRQDFPQMERLGSADAANVRVSRGLPDGTTRSAQQFDRLPGGDTQTATGRDLERPEADVDLRTGDGGEAAVRRPGTAGDRPGGPSDGGADRAGVPGDRTADRGAPASDLRGGRPPVREVDEQSLPKDGTADGHPGGLRVDPGEQPGGGVRVPISGDGSPDGDRDGDPARHTAGRIPPSPPQPPSSAADGPSSPSGAAGGPARVPFDFERFFTDPRWADEATRFEQRLGAYYFTDPATVEVAREALGRLRDVLTDLTPRRPDETPAAHARRVEGAFFRDDAADSAGQVGSTVRLDDLLAHGNLRELMTAFYNAAYFNRSAPNTLAATLIDIFDGGRWDAARDAGMDVAQLRTMRHQLDESINRAILGRLEARFDPTGFRFGRDPFGTGNVVMLSDRGIRDLADVLQSQASRHDRTPEEQERLGLISNPGRYDAMGVPLGRFERAYLESRLGRPLTPDTPLPWREGVAAHESTGSRWARRVAGDGFPVVDGVSATTTRMLTTARFLGLDLARVQRFLGALMGWMLPGRDHSLFEMFRGAQIAGIARTALPPGGRFTAVDLHRNLPGLDLNTLRTRILPDGLFPHEARYLQRATDPGGFTETQHPMVRDTAARLWPQLRDGRVTDPDLADWLRRNGIDPTNQPAVRALGERLSEPHVMALTVYTRHSHYLINNVIRTQLWTAGVSEPAVRARMASKVRELVSNYVENLRAGRKALPLPLALRPVLHVGEGHLDSRSALSPLARDWMAAADRVDAAGRLAHEHQTAGRAREARQARAAGVRAQREQSIAWRRITAALQAPTARLFDEVRWHADMVHDALTRLPALGSPGRPALAFRGDWLTPGHSPIYGSRLRPHGTAREFLSVSRRLDVAVRFMAENPASDRRVLVVYRLTGGQARDISVFSSFAEDQEAVLPPRSRTRRVDDPDLIERIRADLVVTIDSMVRDGVIPNAPEGYQVIVMEEE